MKDPTSQWKKAKSQELEFRRVARELECDEDEAAFDERLKGLAQPKLSATAKTDDSDEKAPE